ncbi:MAG: VanZ family protein [Candidatus Eisenbacteria bacterium]
MRFLYAWLPFLLLEATVIFFSSRPGSSIHLPFARVDKVLHFGEYAALGFLLYRALRMSGGGRREAVVSTLALIALLGLGDEAFQSRIPGRDSSIYDWFADLLGGSAGVAFGARLESLLPWLFSFKTEGGEPTTNPRVEHEG